MDPYVQLLKNLPSYKVQILIQIQISVQIWTWLIFDTRRALRIYIPLKLVILEIRICMYIPKKTCDTWSMDPYVQLLKNLHSNTNSNLGKNLNTNDLWHAQNLNNLHSYKNLWHLTTDPYVHLLKNLHFREVLFDFWKLVQDVGARSCMTFVLIRCRIRMYNSSKVYTHISSVASEYIYFQVYMNLWTHATLEIWSRS